MDNLENDEQNFEYTDPIRDSTGSQCSSQRAGLMCSYRLAPVIRRVFNTINTLHLITTNLRVIDRISFLSLPTPSSTREN